ncbi:MAG TPA: tetratricopeptide repeat protein [Planctomycetaceae bacterium]
MRDRISPDHYARGELLYEHKKFDLAAKELRAATAADPGDPCAPALLAVVLVESGDARQARAAAEEAVRRGPDSAFAHMALGYALDATERPEAAVRAAREALRLDPRDVDAHILMGRLFEARERWSDALEHADSALDLSPLDTRAAALRGKALVRLGRLPEAIETLKAALRHAPEDASLHAMLGWALLHASAEDEAFPHLREALRLDPTSQEARAYLVDALKARNRLYKFLLRMTLWQTRSRRLTPIGVALWSVGFLVASIVILQTRPVLIFGLLAGLGMVLLAVVVSGLSVPIFDLLLQFDPLGRHLLTRRECFGAWVVGGFVAAAGAALLAAAFDPFFLTFAIPTGTLLPWVLYRVIVEPPGMVRWVRLVWLVPSIAGIEVALLIFVMIRPLGLDEEILGEWAGVVFDFSLLWLMGFGWMVLPIRLAAGIFRRFVNLLKDRGCCGWL